MDKLLILNIQKVNGTYKFTNTNCEILKEHFDISNQSDDNLNTIEDITVSIIDEEPDTVLIYLREQNAFLVYGILENLVENGYSNIILYDESQKKQGNLQIEELSIPVIRSLESMLDIDFKKGANQLKLEDLYEAKEFALEKNIAQLDAFYTGIYRVDSYITNILALEVSQDTLIQNGNLYNKLLNINSMVIYKEQSISKDRFSQRRKEQGQVPYYDVCQVSETEVLYEGCVQSVISRHADYKNYSAGINYLRITDSEDLRCLLQDVEIFGTTGQIVKQEIKLENTCAWLPGSCLLHKVCRCGLNQQGEFYTCHNEKKSIGTLDDNYFKLLYKASEIRDQTMEERHCSQCVANAYCSKCAMLAQGITADIYCDTIRNNQLIQQFLICHDILQKISCNSKQFTREVCGFVEVSNIARPLVFVEDIGGASNRSFRGEFFGFRLKDKYFALSHKTSQIIRMDERLIFIAEAVVRGFTEKEIPRLYQQKYQFEESEACEQVKAGLAIIQKYKTI